MKVNINDFKVRKSIIRRASWNKSDWSGNSLIKQKVAWMETFQKIRSLASIERLFFKMHLYRECCKDDFYNYSQHNRNLIICHLFSHQTFNTRLLKNIPDHSLHWCCANANFSLSCLSTLYFSCHIQWCDSCSVNTYLKC